MPQTIWLASYPKSGNTWFRIFLANLLHPELAPVDVNRLPMQMPIAGSRSAFDEALGVPSALLTTDEVERLRPAADRRFAARWDGRPRLRKAHDAYTWLPDGRPLMGRGPDFAALYILRDPRDVAVSMTNHFACTLEEAVGNLCDTRFAIAGGRRGAGPQFEQRLLSWEGHVASWLGAPLPLHLMRYERMRGEPLATFRAAVRFLGLDHGDEAIEAALDASRFERLQRQEERRRFRETPHRAPRFFRSARVGEGVERLSPEQRRRLEAMMDRVMPAIAGREAR